MMKLTQLLPLASQLLGRDLSPDIEAFSRTRVAIGRALNQEGQLFVSQNWRGIPAFLETPDGQKAITEFLDAWVIHLSDKYKAALPKGDDNAQKNNDEQQKQ